MELTRQTLEILRHFLKSQRRVVFSACKLNDVNSDTLCFSISYFMIQFILLVSRQGKVRLVKWFVQSSSQKDRHRDAKEVTQLVLHRGPKLCNVIEWRTDQKIIYRRYASLYFIACVDADDNELIVLETLHHFVEILDRYFGNVCELDLIFNFHKAYYILDELIVAGELQETSKRTVLRLIAAQDQLMQETEGTNRN